MTNFLSEFLGTALLIALGDGVVANVILPKTKGNGGGLISICFGWGLAVFVACMQQHHTVGAFKSGGDRCIGLVG